MFISCLEWLVNFLYRNWDSWEGNDQIISNNNWIITTGAPSSIQYFLLVKIQFMHAFVAVLGPRMELFT
jgi:hypothetical protein